jgi:sensor domain CHASE-containing protein
MQNMHLGIIVDWKFKESNIDSDMYKNSMCNSVHIVNDRTLLGRKKLQKQCVLTEVVHQTTHSTEQKKFFEYAFIKLEL